MTDLEDFDDLEDELQTLIMTDDEGEDMEFLIIDSVKYKGFNYLLVIESELAEDDEAEAVVLKELQQEGSEDEVCYESIIDDNEFEKVAEMFRKSNGDYELE